MDAKSEDVVILDEEVKSEEVDVWKTNKDEYNHKLHKLAKKHDINTKIIPEDKYHRLIEHVKLINKRGSKSSVDFRRNRKYALIDMPNGEQRLFYKPALLNNKKLIMVTMEETYDIIHKCHLEQTNHGGRTRMMEELKQTYYNITTECIMLYLSMCHDCKVNRAWARKTKKGQDKIPIDYPSPIDSSTDPLGTFTAIEMEKEVLSETTYKYPELYLRAQMDLLSVTNEPNEKYKYLMVYRNYATKFIHLKAMAGISVDEAAEVLLEIFLVFGAPNILQSKNGVAILKPICRRISSLYADFKIVYSENVFPESAFEGKSNEDILKKLNAWLVMTQNIQWQNGVKYIQHSLNTTFHETLCRTPSELVFGKNPGKGTASFLNDTKEIVSESELVAVLDSKNGEQDSNMNDNLLLTESLIIPKELIKLKVELMSNEENVE